MLITLPSISTLRSLQSLNQSVLSKLIGYDATVVMISRGRHLETVVLSFFLIKYLKRVQQDLRSQTLT